MKNPLKAAVSEDLWCGATGFEPAASKSQRAWEDFFWAFIAVFRYFCSVSVTLWHSLNLRFTGVPGLSVVMYVVKNASHPVSGDHSPVPDRKRFAVSGRLHCNSEKREVQVFSARGTTQSLRRYKQGKRGDFPFCDEATSKTQNEIPQNQKTHTVLLGKWQSRICTIVAPANLWL